MIYWLSSKTICILCTIVEDPMTVSMSIRGASTEHQQFSVLPCWLSKGCIVTSFPRWSIGRLYRYKRKSYTHCPTLEMTVNGASTMFGPVSLITNWIGNCGNPQSIYRPPICAKMLVRTKLLRLKNDCQRSVNIVWYCILDKQLAMHRH